MNATKFHVMEKKLRRMIKICSNEIKVKNTRYFEVKEKERHKNKT